MKKFALFTILCIYLAANMGATIQLHKCCGDIVNWAVNKSVNTQAAHNSCCGENSTDKEDICCEEKEVNFKLDHPQILVASDFLFNAHFNIHNTLNSFYIHFLEVADECVFTTHTYSNPPPRPGHIVGLYLFYSQLKVSC